MDSDLRNYGLAVQIAQRAHENARPTGGRYFMEEEGRVQDLLIAAAQEGYRAGIEALEAELAEKEAAMASVWRNAITNSAALVDNVRKRHRPTRQNKALAAFDADLNRMIDDWWSFSRGTIPKSYDDAEAAWKRFYADKFAKTEQPNG